jgi:hypothetical protein
MACGQVKFSVVRFVEVFVRTKKHHHTGTACGTALPAHAVVVRISEFKLRGGMLVTNQPTARN